MLKSALTSVLNKLPWVCRFKMNEVRKKEPILYHLVSVGMKNFDNRIVASNGRGNDDFLGLLLHS